MDLLRYEVTYILVTGLFLLQESILLAAKSCTYSTKIDFLFFGMVIHFAVVHVKEILVRK